MSHACWQRGQALAGLARASVLIYRKFKSAWQLWDGSDLDVGALVERVRMGVQARGGLAEQLGKHLRAPVIVAARHGYRTGSLRTLVGRFASAPVLGSSTRTEEGDGDLLLLLPDRLEDLRELAQQIRAGELAVSERPVVHALPEHPAELMDAALTFFALHEALIGTPELESDPVARRELAERRQSAFDRLVGVVTTTYARRWIWRSQDVDVAGRPGLAASRIFDAAYSASPCVRNELVNRDELSSSAAAARRELMEFMVDRSETPRLGIEGYPPTLSLYRSVLEATGLHRPVDPDVPEGPWTFSAPAASSSVAAVWAKIESHVRAAPAGRTSIASIAHALARPPFGVRAGVAPIIILAWARARLGETFWYEENSFVPTVGAELVHRLLRKPEDFELQLTTVSATLAKIVAALSGQPIDAGSSARAPLRVIRGLVRTVAGLSPYALATQRISPKARRVRTALKTARDPVRLLLETLPEALELPAFQGGEAVDAAAADRFVRELGGALKELAAAEDVLHGSLERTLTRLLGCGAPGTEARAEMRARATALLASGLDLPPLTRRVCDLTAELDPRDAESRALWLDAAGTALLGKAPSQWSDADLDRFALVAAEPCRSFLAAEQLALEVGAAGESAVRLVRVSLLDNRGERQVGVGVLKAGEADKVQLLEAEIARRAAELGLTTPGLVYAVLSGMMAAMNGTSVQVIKDERVSDADPHA